MAKKIFAALALIFIAFAALSAQGLLPPAGAESGHDTGPLFPAAFFNDYIDAWNAKDAARPYWVFTEDESADFFNRYTEHGR